MAKLDPTKLLSNRHLERAFGVTTMTLYLWRKGTPTKAPLPVVSGTDRRVSYKPRDVEIWARKNNVTLLVPDLSSLLDAPDMQIAKPGPKGGARAATKRMTARMTARKKAS